MRIAVLHTGRDDKQKLYSEWLHLLQPDAELVTLSAEKKNESELATCDGIVFTGGGDVNPKLYGEAPTEYVQGIDEQRDLFECMLLEKSLLRQLPVLGICRGLQAINVFFGGSLYQDVEQQGFKKHSGASGKDLRHGIDVVPHTTLAHIVGVTHGNVNSCHHQAINNVAEVLTVSGYSEDGLVESLEWKEKTSKQFLLLAQWHPERMNDVDNPFAVLIGRAFFDAVQLKITK